MRWLQKTLALAALAFPFALPQLPAQSATTARDVTVVRETNATSSSAYYALVIGNNHYDHLGSAANLSTAIHDATEVADLLHTRYGFQVTLLTDANRSQILGALARYRKTLPADANLLIYYAGHGYHDKDADQAYWLPTDADRDSNVNWISSDDITRDLKVLPARHVLVIADSCYSGYLTRARSADVNVDAGERTAYLAKVTASRSRMLMSSGSDEPVSDGGPDGHSVFAAALLKSLRSMTRDVFTGSELFYQFVQPGVAGNSRQLPQYEFMLRSGHEYGDFVFRRDPSETTGTPAATPKVAVASPPGLLPLLAWVATRNGYILHSEPGSNWKIVMYRQDGLLGNAVSFPDPQSGWIATTKTLLHTTDGGKSWREQLHANRIGSVSFVDANTGWVVADQNLFHTVDAGKNWSRQISNQLSPDDTVVFISPLDGWIVGSFDKILHTTSGGSTWVRQRALGTMDIYTSATFLDHKTGWVVGTSGAILHTTDGGTTWTRQRSGTDAVLFSVSFLDPQEGWIVGSNGVMLHTSDGGASWTAQKSGMKGTLRSIRFVTPRLGLAAGDGVILSTSDGGRTWTPQREDDFDTFSSVAVFPESSAAGQPR